MLKLERALFPQRPADFISMKRVPVLYRPIMGSPEQFVIGALCFNDIGHHLERANRLDRLKNLYGDNSAGVLLAIELGLDVLAAALTHPGFNVVEFESAVSGMHLGEIETTEAASFKVAARLWLAAHSSLWSFSEPT